jgi:phage shock protein PspC (stress-responsive transcriptional regulator)
MGLSDELGRLSQLHERGQLSDDEFARAKARVLGGPLDGGTSPLQAVNALRRSLDDRWLGGVCGGITRATGVASWVWRLMFTLLALCAGTGVMAYLLLWVLVPADAQSPTPPHARLTAG